MSRATLLGVVLLLWAAVPLPAQQCDAPSDAIRVYGEVETPVVLTRQDLRAMDRVGAHVADREGDVVTYEGVTLRTLLDRAGVPSGRAMRGRGMSAYVVVEARNDDRATFALPELDGDHWDRLPFLADRVDGEPLEEDQGPFRIVVPDSEQHGRWVRQVECLRVGYP